MSFNVSRFLVRVRQFWTRERLVPVLGATAIFMFLLNFYTYLTAEFEKRPIVAIHALDHFGEFHFDTDDRENVIIYRHDYNYDDSHWDRHDRERALKKHRRHLRKRLRIHRGHDGEHKIEIHDHFDFDEKEVKEMLFKRNGEQDQIRIEINGEVLTIDKIDSEI